MFGSRLRIVAFAAGVTGILLVGLWLIRGGAAVESDPADPLRVAPERVPGVPAEDAERAPIIGAFSDRVSRRLGAKQPATRPLTGSLTIRGSNAIWRERPSVEFARAPAFTGLLDLGPLHRGDVVLRNVVLTRPVLHLREADGTWNYERVLAGLLDGENGVPLNDGVRDRIALISGATIENGTVHVRQPEQVFTIENLNARLRRVAFSGPAVPYPEIVAASASAVLFQPSEARRTALQAEEATARILEESVAFSIERAGIEGAQLADVRGAWSPDLPFYGLRVEGRVLDVRLADVAEFLPDPAPPEGRASLAFSIEPVSGTTSRITLTDVRFEGEGSLVTGAVTLHAEPEQFVLSDADLRLDPLSIALVEAFTDPIPASGMLRGTVAGPASDLRFDLEATLLTATVTEPFPVGLTGSVALTAEGPALRQMDVRLEDAPLLALRAFAPGLPLTGLVSGTLTLTGPPAVAPLTVDLRLGLAAGAATLAGTIDLTAPVPAYDVTGELLSVNAQMLLEPTVPPVLLTGRFALAGRGIDPALADLRLEVAAGFRGWLAEPGDTLMLRARVSGGALAVDSFALNLATLSASALGEWRFVEPVAGVLRYAMAVSALEPWGPYLPYVTNGTAAGAVHVAGTVSGTLAQPQLAGELRGVGMRFDGWQVADVDATYAFALGGVVPEGTLRIRGRQVVTPTAGSFATVALAADVVRPDLGFEVTATRADGGSIVLAGVGHVPEVGPIDVFLQTADIDLETRWTLGQPALFRWGEETGFVALGFQMHEVEGAGLIQLDGTLLPLARADFVLETAALPVGDVQELIGIRPYATGHLWTVARLTGPAATPTVSVEFRLDQGTIEGVAFPRLEGNVTYAPSTLTASAIAEMAEEGSFELQLEVPAILDLAADTVFRLVDTGTVSGALVATGVVVDPLEALSPQIRDLTGQLDGRIELNGTVEEPLFEGRMVLTNGSLRIPALTQTYIEVTGHAELDGRRLIVPAFQARSDGFATLTGEIFFATLTNPVANLNVRFDRFRAAGVRNQRGAAVYGDLTVRGPIDAVEVGGAIRLADGFVQIPAFGSTVDEMFADLPRVGPPGDVVVPAPPLEDVVLRDLRVSVGSDVWFIAEAARAQVAGDLTINRVREAFTIVGTLEGERGMYTLQAGPIIRRFEIVSAQVRFLGAPEPNPVIDIVARRIVFDPAGRQIEVEVAIVGTLRSPRLALASPDAPTIPESELLSFLLFGRPSLELGAGGIPGDVLLEATFLGGLAELATLELEETLVRDLGLGLDIFQVRFGPGGVAGLGAPRFLFGWELGRDVFLTAESGVAALFGSSDATPDAWAIRLEWAFDRQSRLRASYEPVTPSRYLRGLGVALPIRPPQQFSLEARRRWTY